MTSNFIVILPTDATCPVQYIIGTWLIIHTSGDRFKLLNTCTVLIDDLILPTKNTIEGILKTRRVPSITLRLLFPAVNGALTRSARTVTATQLPVTSGGHGGGSQFVTYRCDVWEHWGGYSQHFFITRAKFFNTIIGVCTQFIIFKKEIFHNTITIT